MQYSIKDHVRVEKSPSNTIMIDDIHGDFYECNNTAIFLLDELFKSTSREGLVSKILDKYEIEPCDAHSQVDQYLNTLRYIGILNEK